MIKREIHEFDLRKIAESGQCFRMNLLSSGAYCITAFDRYLEITDMGNDTFAFSCSDTDFRNIWMDYFDLSSDYGTIESRIPADDLFLRRAVEYGRGMRILRQDPWEVTASFIISQRKSIPAIKSAVEGLCTRYGAQKEQDGKKYFCFPSAETLSKLICDDLHACALGYRDKYILSAAKSVAGGEVRFPDLRDAGEESAKAVLKSMYGVGVKVADCILLFGLHYINAFPVDTWIRRIIDAEYSGRFPADRYDGCLGIIQQYMFYYGRSREYRSAAPLNPQPADPSAM